MPSFEQSIFSVQTAKERGASTYFMPSSDELSSSDGTKFSTEKDGHWYFLKNATVISQRNHVIF